MNKEKVSFENKITPARSEGFINYKGYKTWYKVVGDLNSDAVPLIVINGGPGFPSDGCFTFETLADERPVIFYDQLGSGRSDRPGDPSIFTIETYLEELGILRTELGLDRVHLVGHSWGGMLMMEYAFTKPEGIEGYIFASSPCSTKQWVDACDAFRLDLPKYVQNGLLRCERTVAHYTTEIKPDRPGFTQAELEKGGRATRFGFKIALLKPVQWFAALASFVPALRHVSYEILGLQFIKKHTMHMELEDIPERFFNAVKGVGIEVSKFMWGPSGFISTGTLQDWDVRDRLHEITYPTLITSGRYDEASPVQMQTILDSVHGSRWVCFENSGHCPHVSEPDEYFATVRNFLREVES